MTTAKPLDFWNDHSLEFLEMAMKRDYKETVQSFLRICKPSVIHGANAIFIAPHEFID